MFTFAPPKGFPHHLKAVTVTPRSSSDYNVGPLRRISVSLTPVGLCVCCRLLTATASLPSHKDQLSSHQIMAPSWAVVYHATKHHYCHILKGHAFAFVPKRVVVVVFFVIMFLSHDRIPKRILKSCLKKHYHAMLFVFITFTAQYINILSRFDSMYV